MISVFILSLELIVLFFLKQLTGTSIGSIEATLLILLFSLAYTINVYTSKRYREGRTVLLIAYAIRLFYLFFDIFGRNIYTLPHSGGDSEVFYNNAIYYAVGNNYWKGITVETFGFLVKCFGESRLYVQFLLMLTSVATFHTIYRILTNEVKIQARHRNIGLLVFAVIPNYAIISALFLRESLITFIISISLWMFIRWWNNKGEIFFYLSFAFVFIAALYHSGVVGMAAGYILIRLLYDRKSGKYRLTIASIVSAVMFLLIFVFLFNNYSSLLFGKMRNLETLADISVGQGRGNTSYAAIAGNSNNILNFIIYSPLRVLLFLFTPLPFQIRGMSDIIAMLFSAWFYLWIYVRAIRYLTHKDNPYTKLIFALLIVGLATAFVFGWGSTNIGTNVRHRDKFVGLYAIILSITYEDPIINRIRFIIQKRG